MAGERKVIAFPVYPGVNLLELDSTLGFLRALVMRGYEVAVVGESRAQLDTDTPLQIAPSRTFAELPRPHAAVVVGSSGIEAINVLGNETLLGYLGQVAAHAHWVAAVGTGSLLLAAVGLLAGKTAATHWAYAGLLEGLGAKYSSERWVDAGDVFTSAGGSGGIDLALYLLARFGSRNQAKLVQLFAEYDPEPPLGGIEWSRLDRNALAPLLQERRTELAAALSSRPAVLAALDRLAAAPIGG